MKKRFRSLSLGGILIVAQSGIAAAGGDPITGRLDISDDSYEGISANDRAFITVQDGGEIEDYYARDESFTAVQKGGTVDFLTVSDKATAQICGGHVTSLMVEPGAIARITSGAVHNTFIAPGGVLHVYGTELSRDEISISGKWHDGSLFRLPISDGGDIGAVVLNDLATAPIAKPGPYAHYRLDESGTLKTYDATTFLHRAAGGNFVTTLDNANSERGDPVATPGQDPLTSFGSSVYLDGGAAAIIPGDRLPRLDQGATVSLWMCYNGAPSPYSKTVMLKTVDDGRELAMALCIGSDGRLIWASLDGPTTGTPDEPLVPGETYHIVLTYTTNEDGTEVTGALYLNGKLVQNDRNPFHRSTTPVGFDGLEQNLEIGSYQGSEVGLDGQIDDVQIYDRPLSAREIKSLYGNPGVTITDIDSDTWLDDEEYANHGTLELAPPYIDDLDRDGFSNQTEIEITKTDPHDYSSRLHIMAIEISGPQRRITFPARTGVRYQLEHSPDGRTWNSAGLPRTAVEDATMAFTHLSTKRQILYRIAVR